MSTLEDTLAFQLAACNIEYVREYQFDKTRRWRLDFAVPSQMLAVEYEGGTWVGGGHNFGGRFHRDVEKYNELALQGWRLLRITADMVKDGRAIRLIERALGGTG